jgi:transaldolase
MKIFLDTAHIPSIKKWLDTGLIDGITTNPSNLSKEGADPRKTILEICALFPEGHVNVEVTHTAPADVYKQAKEIAALAENVIVKIPCHATYYPVINKLVHEEIPLNITLVFTLLQALMMSKLGVYYISPFVGRWDDIDVDGIETLENIKHMLDAYEFETEVLAASIRHVRHFHLAIQAGADVVTLPVEVLEQAMQSPLTDAGIAKFNADWQKLGIKQFP